MFAPTKSASSSPQTASSSVDGSSSQMRLSCEQSHTYKLGYICKNHTKQTKNDNKIKFSEQK